MRKFQTHEPPTRFQHPKRVLQGHVHVCHIAKSKRNCIQIKRIIFKWQCLCISFDKGKGLGFVQKSTAVPLASSPLTDPQHFGINVTHCHLNGILSGAFGSLMTTCSLDETKCHISCTPSDIQHVQRRRRRGLVGSCRCVMESPKRSGSGGQSRPMQQVVLPQSMQSSRHEIIHDIIRLGYRLKYLPHLGFLFLRSNRSEPKVSRRVIYIVFRGIR
mmetsp:Transcript_13598/g.24644  ORF Transcript_13598/g.24644 Transcript_13598/m.24644 type:complete len:216 (-) Transcript_13598:127-774(-)